MSNVYFSYVSCISQVYLRHVDVDLVDFFDYVELTIMSKVTMLTFLS